MKYFYFGYIDPLSYSYYPTPLNYTPPTYPILPFYYPLFYTLLIPPPMSLRNPFVLQCKSCNSIVCDSFSLLDYKNSSLIFNSIASTVTLDSSKHTDSDTVYSFIRCKCSNTIGKRYYTTNADMNGYSGMYFISKESVFSYMLGGNSEFKSVTLYEIAEDVEKLQKLCLFLYKKINNTK